MPRQVSVEQLKLEFAGVILRLAQNHARALMRQGLSFHQALSVVTGALWRACIEGLADAADADAANDREGPAERFGEDQQD